MGFFSSLFGIAPGPTQSAQDFSNRQNNLALAMNNDFSERFGEQSDVFKNLTSQLTPIANLGPNQQGFSPQELAAMNSQAINNAGAASRNAQQSVGNALAGQGGGGTSGLVSGIESQIRGTVASNSANELASAQNQITQNNYETGRQNFWQSTAGEQTLANAENPTPYGQMAQSSLAEAQNSAAEIDKEKQARSDSWGGLAKGLIGAGADVLTGGLSGGLQGAWSAGKKALGSFTGSQFGSSDTPDYSGEE